VARSLCYQDDNGITCFPTLSVSLWDLFDGFDVLNSSYICLFVLYSFDVNPEFWVGLAIPNNEYNTAIIISIIVYSSLRRPHRVPPINVHVTQSHQSKAGSIHQCWLSRALPVRNINVHIHQRTSTQKPSLCNDERSESWRLCLCLLGGNNEVMAIR